MRFSSAGRKPDHSQQYDFILRPPALPIFPGDQWPCWKHWVWGRIEESDQSSCSLEAVCQKVIPKQTKQRRERTRKDIRRPKAGGFVMPHFTFVG